MKRTVPFIYLICLSAFFIAANALNALTIPASEDSYTAPRNTLSYSTNNANALVVDATRKSYLYFDLSDIPPDAVVRWAKLRLFLPTVRTPGAGLSVHLVTGTWNESTRLADVPSIVSGSLGMIAPSKMASRRFVTVDVTSTVQQWINGGTLNEGLAIQPIVKAGSPTASVMLTSKEGPVFGLPAELDIEFQPEGGVDKPVTVAQLPSSFQALLNPPPVVLNTINQLPPALRSFLSPTITSQTSIPFSILGNLSVQAKGVGDLSFQWLRNGVPIQGANSAELAIERLENGTYKAVISNGFTSVESKDVQLNVPTFILVNGGALPASSALGEAPVETFYISKTEVTWGEWRSVREWALNNGYNDLVDPAEQALGWLSVYNGYVALGDNCAVFDVNVYDALKWCNARSEKEGKTPAYWLSGGVYRTGDFTPSVLASANGYRLPTEPEWEFAARGGIHTKGFKYSGSNDPNEVAWNGFNSNARFELANYAYAAYSESGAVGEKTRNELGIYDMSGHVAEWCFTPWDSLGTRWVVRGGHWSTDNVMAEVNTRSFGNQVDRTNVLGFRVALNAITQMVLVRGGTISHDSQLGTVAVGTFSIGRTEVTWTEWETVRNWAQAHGYPDLVGVGTNAGPRQTLANNYPVTNVNWYDVVKWCNARSEKEGKTPVYRVGGDVYRFGNAQEWGNANPEIVPANGYRLPTEAEWEFAARGGANMYPIFYWGIYNLDTIAWHHGNSGGEVHEVAMKQSNQLGLYDMLGNVGEWCVNWSPSTEGYNQVIRGGDWSNGRPDVSQRHFDLAENRGSNTGFRVATSGEYALGITAQPSVSSYGTKLSVVAAGAGTLTYQWRLNGVEIAGGTSSQLSTQGLQSGTYTVVVSNGFASVTSNSIQFSAPVNLGFTLVTGGTLPASSPLGPVPVETFYIGRTEVTWGEWQAVRDWAVANGYADLANVGQGVGDNYPVSHVNWYDVVKWCNARSEREGKTPVYKVEGEVYRTGQSTPEEIPSANGYRLPSEKEWEFAARGGKQTQGYIYSGSNSLDDVGWYNGNSFGSVYQVANKRANELSIFDMSGNVLEWTSDWSPGYVGLYRLHRGGGAAGPWYTYAHDGEVARRGHAPPDQSTEIINILGFRVATSGEYALGITAQPSLSSDGARISVQAGGSGTLTYQWMRDGVVTSGATSSQLSTEGLQSGTYTVVVSNGFSSVTSGNLQYPPSPIGTFALVTGGTLPASSPFGGVPVDTFYIGKTEITWGEWKTVRTWATANGYTGLANVGQGLGDSYPVSHVNWDDAVKWCNARSEKEGKTPVYKAGADVYRTGEVSEPELVSSANGYRLPSGAEWEFAARGGTHSNGYTYSGSNDLGAVGWNAGNSGYAVHEVGKKQANELGIFDMTGNLTEWSGDMAQFTETVLRLEIGSNFNHSGGSYMMSYVPPNLAYYQAGFRVALSSVP